MIWHKTSEELPEKSIPCLVIIDGELQEIPYELYEDYDGDLDVYVNNWRECREWWKTYNVNEVEYWITIEEIFNDFRNNN